MPELNSIALRKSNTLQYTWAQQRANTTTAVLRGRTLGYTSKHHEQLYSDLKRLPHTIRSGIKFLESMGADANRHEIESLRRIHDALLNEQGYDEPIPTHEYDPNLHTPLYADTVQASDYYPPNQV